MVTPLTKNFEGSFCRTCQFQRGGFPAICQFPGVITISRLLSSISAVIPLRLQPTLVLVVVARNQSINATFQITQLFNGIEPADFRIFGGVSHQCRNRIISIEAD
jgi:hypothetical protein